MEQILDDGADRLAGAIRAFLRDQFGRSPELRALAVELAKAVIEEAARHDDGETSPICSDAAGRAEGLAAAGGEMDHGAIEPPTTPVTPTADERRQVIPLRLGDAAVHLEVGGSARDLAAAQRAAQDGVERPARPEPRPGARDDEIDLRMVARRSRLKAESCRLHIDRRAAEGDRERERPIVARMNAMIAEAKSLPNCFLWVFWPQRQPPTDSRLRTIADAYDALADAAEMCARAVDPDEHLTGDELAQAMQWLAEASSALRFVISWTWLTEDDRDQDAAHQWLRRETATRWIYVRRHMALDDRADPGRAEALRAEIRVLAAEADRRRRLSQDVDRLLAKVRYHARRLASETDADRAAYDGGRVNDALDAIVALGVPASDRRLRELRESLEVSAFPPEVPPHPVLLPTDDAPRVEAGAGPDEEAGPDAEGCWSERVERVRAMLAGRTVVMIGGDPRPQAIDRIKSAFGPSRVEWVDLVEHGPGEPMRAPIARAETGLVAILVRLCGHHHVDEARQWAAACGKACVMLPAGYNPEQIAVQVLGQVSDRLVASLDATGGEGRGEGRGDGRGGGEGGGAGIGAVARRR